MPWLSIPAAPSYAPFEADTNCEAKYGLPAYVRFCRLCVISNQRPNSAVEFAHTRASRKETINIDADGVCDACRVAELKKRNVDWNQREAELRELCDRFRRSDGSYDCLVPGSGGKDSFYAAHVLKYRYGMHPLTVTWAPHIYTQWGWDNLQAWIHAGFDNVLCTPNGRVHRLLTRLAVENLFHPFQPFIIGQKALPPRLAVQYGIPLVFYGESEAEYGNPLASAQSAQRDWEYFAGQDKSKIFFSGVSVAELNSEFGIAGNDLHPYLPADPAELERNKVEVHYLGYYLRWHPQNCYYYAVEHGGFQAAPERTAGTYSKYNSIDDRMDDFHYYTTYIKFGIGRATYDAAQEIRSGDITRDEGVALVRRFDGEFPERFAAEVFRYLSIDARSFPVAVRNFEQPVMDRQYFLALADQFRSPHLWRWADGGWQLRHAVYQQEVTGVSA
jgi:N-acetyl sugar amidotransferase